MNLFSHCILTASDEVRERPFKTSFILTTLEAVIAANEAERLRGRGTDGTLPPSS